MRERMRAVSKIVVPEALHDKVTVTVKVADVNYEALKPLACRLRQPDGMVGQHSLSAILKQTLESTLVAVVFSRPNRRGLVYPHARLMKFYTVMNIPLPSRRELREQGKLLKSFCVLIKRKLGRPHLTRSLLFRKLVAMVFHAEEP